jgi:hypothetical protein
MITLRIIGVLGFSIIWYSINYKTLRFGNWIFLSSVREEDIYSFGSLGKS